MFLKLQCRENAINPSIYVMDKKTQTYFHWNAGDVKELPDELGYRLLAKHERLEQVSRETIENKKTRTRKKKAKMIAESPENRADIDQLFR